MCVWKPEGISNSLELELQVVVSHLLWVLGTGLWSFVRTVCAPNHQALEPKR